MGAITNLADTFTQARWWERYVELGEQMIEVAEQIGEDVKAETVEIQEKIGSVLTRLEKGEMSALGAKRAVGRYRNAIRAKFEGGGEKLLWEAYERFWDATGDVIQIIGAIGTLFQLFA